MSDTDKWVVCFGMMGRCSVYGKVLQEDSLSVTIDDKVGGWYSNIWNRNYVKFFDSEDEAKGYYDEHKE